MSELKIVKTEELPEIEYFKDPSTKMQIVLHHTVSAVGKYIDDYFKEDKGKSKIAVAYVVDKDGTVFQLFDPQYWAWHIGKGSSQGNNRHSIAIELVNEGPLYKRDDESFYWWIDSANPRGKYRYNDLAVEGEYRGFSWWASYTKEQVDSLGLLLPYLLDRFNIRPEFVNTRDYDSKYLFFKGIVMHVNLRADKTDLSPAFDLNNVERILERYIIDRMSIIPKPLVLDIREFLKDKIVVEKIAEVEQLSNDEEIKTVKKNSNKKGKVT